MAKEIGPKSSPKPPAKAPARRTRQSPEMRRQDLLAVTVSCLARLGPRGTTGREICRQAGVSHGLIRHYFRNPDNLLLETYEQLCEDMLVSLGAASALGGGAAADPWAALHNFYVAVFSPQWASPEIIGAWMVFWQLVRSREDFAEVSQNYNRRQSALLEGLVRALPAREGGIEVATAVAIISAVMDGLWINYYLSEKRLPAEMCVSLCDETGRRLLGG